MNFNLMLSIILIAWFLFMVLAPSKWGAIVEKENQLWVKIGIFKPSTVEKLIKFEKGMIFKAIVALSALLFVPLWNIW